MTISRWFTSRLTPVDTQQASHKQTFPHPATTASSKKGLGNIAAADVQSIKLLNKSTLYQLSKFHRLDPTHAQVKAAAESDPDCIPSLSMFYNNQDASLHRFVSVHDSLERDDVPERETYCTFDGRNMASIVKSIPQPHLSKLQLTNTMSAHEYFTAVIQLAHYFTVAGAEQIFPVLYQHADRHRPHALATQTQRESNDMYNRLETSLATHGLHSGFKRDADDIYDSSPSSQLKDILHPSNLPHELHDLSTLVSDGSALSSSDLVAGLSNLLLHAQTTGDLQLTYREKQQHTLPIDEKTSDEQSTIPSLVDRPFQLDKLEPVASIGTPGVEVYAIGRVLDYDERSSKLSEKEIRVPFSQLSLPNCMHMLSLHDMYMRFATHMAPGDFQMKARHTIELKDPVIKDADRVLFNGAKLIWAQNPDLIRLFEEHSQRASFVIMVLDVIPRHYGIPVFDFNPASDPSKVTFEWNHQNLFTTRNDAMSVITQTRALGQSALQTMHAMIVKFQSVLDQGEAIIGGKQHEGLKLITQTWNATYKKATEGYYFITYGYLFVVVPKLFQWLHNFCVADPSRLTTQKAAEPVTKRPKQALAAQDGGKKTPTPPPPPAKGGAKAAPKAATGKGKGKGAKNRAEASDDGRGRTCKKCNKDITKLGKRKKFCDECFIPADQRSDQAKADASSPATSAKSVPAAPIKSPPAVPAKSNLIVKSGGPGNSMMQSITFLASRQDPYTSQLRSAKSPSAFVQLLSKHERAFLRDSDNNLRTIRSLIANVGNTSSPDLDHLCQLDTLRTYLGAASSKPFVEWIACQVDGVNTLHCAVQGKAFQAVDLSRQEPFANIVPTDAKARHALQDELPRMKSDHSKECNEILQLIASNMNRPGAYLLKNQLECFRDLLFSHEPTVSVIRNLPEMDPNDFVKTMYICFLSQPDNKVYLDTLKLALSAMEPIPIECLERSLVDSGTNFALVPHRRVKPEDIDSSRAIGVDTANGKDSMTTAGALHNGFTFRGSNQHGEQVEITLDGQASQQGHEHPVLFPGAAVCLMEEFRNPQTGKLPTMHFDANTDGEGSYLEMSDGARFMMDGSFVTKLWHLRPPPLPATARSSTAKHKPASKPPKGILKRSKAASQ
jgi:hypothetical protein